MLQSFSQPHDVVSSVDGTEVYVVEIGPNRVWKLSSKQQHVGTTPIFTIPVVTNKQLISQEGSGLSPKPAGDGHEIRTKPSSHGLSVEEKARVIPADHQDSTEDRSPERDRDGQKTSASVNPQDHKYLTESEELNSLGGGDSDHMNVSNNQDSAKQESKEEITVSLESNSSEPVTQNPFLMVDVNENSLNPKPTASGKNSSKSGPKSDALDNEDNITAGVIPALVILSVLAVPIVFLLLISITLRLRAYHRDKHRQMNGLHGSRKDLSVGRTRGWWSYMNCCDRQKYKFNRVTLQDFYSDSDSDGV